ncbi:hypothetical protein THAOC_12084, partial [Thalassiosira oceanica]
SPMLKVGAGAPAKTQRDKARKTGPSDDGQYWPEVHHGDSGGVYSRPELTVVSNSGIRQGRRSRDDRRFWPRSTERQRIARSGNADFTNQRFSNGYLRPAESQVNYKYVQMDVEALNDGLSPNIHRSMAVASHGLWGQAVTHCTSSSSPKGAERVATRRQGADRRGENIHRGRTDWADRGVGVRFTLFTLRCGGGRKGRAHEDRTHRLSPHASGDLSLLDIILDCTSLEMGKKSRKPKAGKQKVAPRKEATNTNTPRLRECVQARSPPGATCWICLCEDTEGDRLVRDCSCRGDAGWCHVSCLVSYARNKSDRTVQKAGSSTGNDMAAFLKLWRECMCCKQSHTNYVQMELARAALRYCTEAFPEDPRGKVPGLHLVVDAVMTWRYNGNADAGVAAEGKAASEEFLSINGELNPTSNLSWMCLAQLAEAEGTREGLREAVRCWEMMKRCNPDDVYNIETANFKITKLSGALGEKTTTTEETHDVCECTVDVCEQNYRSDVAASGKDSLTAFVSGIAFGNSLFENGWAIESQRFLKDLVARSRRVLGADHYVTKLAAESLNVRVSVIGKHNSLLVVLSYDEGNDTYTLEKESGGTLAIARTQCIPMATPAIPVICMDLKTAKLNGKLGDATGYDESSQRYKVYFDDKSLRPACIKRVNLRIALEIPDGPIGERKRDRR